MKSVRNWLPAILIMGFIYYLSALPGPTVDGLGLGKESYHINGHFLLYFFLCFTFFKGTKHAVLSVVLSILYGVLDELHQVFVPGRSAGFFDVFVDSVGVLLAGVILWKFYYNLPKKLRNWLQK